MGNLITRYLRLGRHKTTVVLELDPSDMKISRAPEPEPVEPSTPDTMRCPDCEAVVPEGIEQCPSCALLLPKAA
jgi:hypothetical protein